MLRRIIYRPSKRLAWLILAALALVLLTLFYISNHTPYATAQAGCLNPPPELRSWWPGDGDSLDLVGNNPATWRNGAAYGTGMVSLAFSFSGNRDLMITDADNLSAPSLSIDTWIRVAPAFNGNGFILAKTGYGTEYSLRIANYRLVGQVNLVPGGLPGYPEVTSAGPLLIPNTWYHVALTFDGWDYLCVYINGAPTCSFVTAQPPGPIIATDMPLFIGSLGGTSGTYFIGEIDEVEIFSRALKPFEIVELYQSGSDGKCKTGICGMKWNDADGNGNRNCESDGFHNQTINLSDGFTNQTTLTTLNGSYCFTGLPPGDFTISETPLITQTQTFPASGSYTINLPPGGLKTGLNFGNVQYCPASGVKYEDSNNNNQFDPGEGLEGWTIVLDQNGSCLNPQIQTTVTDSNGHFAFDQAVCFLPTHIFELSQPGFIPNPFSGYYGIFINYYAGTNSLEFKNQADEIPDCLVAPPGLSAWLPFDESSGLLAHDLASGNHGFYHSGSGTPPTPMTGYNQRALVFNGDNWVEIANNPGLPVTCSFSVDVWFKTNQTTGSGEIVSKYTTDGFGMDTGVRIYLDNGVPMISLAYGTCSLLGGTCPTFSAGIPLATNTWHFLAVSANLCSGTGHWYIDGYEYPGFSPFNPPVGSAVNSEPTRVGLGFEGLLDEFEEYDRELDQAAIVDLFLSGPNGKCKPVQKLAEASFHSLALLGDGRLIAWGSNTGSNIMGTPQVGVFGFLGDCDPSSKTILAAPDHFVMDCNASLPLDDVIDISASGNPIKYAKLLYAPQYDHSLALQANGTVLAWGYNGQGQLGYGPGGSQERPQPVSIPLATGDQIVAVSAGEGFSLALASSGEVWAFGLNNKCQLGQGSSNPAIQATAVRVKNPTGTGPLSGIKAIAAGGTHALALNASGEVFQWGQFGSGANLPPPFPPYIHQSCLPYQVLDNASNPLTGIVAIAAGGGSYASQGGNGNPHALALNNTGQIYAWGSATTGQLGQCAQALPNPLPPNYLVAVNQTSPVPWLATQIFAGYGTSAALDTSGQVHTWGMDSEGQLGQGCPLAQSPCPVPATTSLPGSLRLISPRGYSHLLAVNASDRIWGWGWNKFGRLTGSLPPSSPPTPPCTYPAVTPLDYIYYSLPVKIR